MKIGRKSGTYVVSGKASALSNRSGVFRDVATPGLGTSRFMSKRVYDQATQRAAVKIREFTTSHEDPAFSTEIKKAG